MKYAPSPPGCLYLSYETGDAIHPHPHPHPHTHPNRTIDAMSMTSLVQLYIPQVVNQDETSNNHYD
jgi:hypothetical protein